MTSLKSGSIPQLLHELRSATRPLHNQLDSLPLSESLFEQRCTPQQYGELISWQWAAHKISECGLATFEWPSTFGYRSRLEALKQESVELNDKLSEQLAPPSTLASATGRAYVLCGSALGGKTILGHLRANPKLAQFSPFPFYLYQREHGLQQWRDFMGFVSKKTWSTTEISEAVEEAKTTFGVFAKAAGVKP